MNKENSISLQRRHTTKQKVVDIPQTDIIVGSSKVGRIFVVKVSLKKNIKKG